MLYNQLNVGGPTMAVIADKCPLDIQIDVIDLNNERISNWNNNDLSLLPIYEPGLAEIVGEMQRKKFTFFKFNRRKIGNS